MEKTLERKLFLTVVLDRSRDTLLDKIKKHVKPGSTIYTDCWAVYDTLSDLPGFNYVYRQVNHSREYVTSDGVHTNSIEGNLTNSYKL